MHASRIDRIDRYRRHSACRSRLSGWPCSGRRARAGWSAGPPHISTEPRPARVHAPPTRLAPCTHAPPPPPHARHAPIPARPSRAHGAQTAGEVTLGRARNGDRKIAYREASGGADLAVVGAAVKLLRRRLRLLKDAHHLGHGGSFERVEDHAPSAIWGVWEFVDFFLVNQPVDCTFFLSQL